MPVRIDRGRAQQLMAEGAVVIDVLPSHEYHDQHLPGAVSIPLKELTNESTAQLARDRPVIVYCWDNQ